MAGRKKAPARIAEWFQVHVLDANGWASIYEASKATGIAEAVLGDIASPDYKNKTIAWHLEAAEKVKVDPTIWLRGCTASKQ